MRRVFPAPKWLQGLRSVVRSPRGGGCGSLRYGYCGDCFAFTIFCSYFNCACAKTAILELLVKILLTLSADFTTLISYIVRILHFWQPAKVCEKCCSLIRSSNRSQKKFPSVKIHFSRVGLPDWRKRLRTRWNTTASDCRHVCQQVSRAGAQITILIDQLCTYADSFQYDIEGHELHDVGSVRYHVSVSKNGYK